MSNKLQNQDFKSEAELISAGATKSSLLNTTKIYSPKSLDVLETVLRKNNFAAIVAPTVSNDSSQGYQVGSVWIDTVGEKSYNCISNGVGTALWKEGGGGVATSNGLTAIVLIANNQVAAVNTGIVFSYPTIKSFEIFAQIIRTTSTNASTEVTKILGVYDIATSSWILTDVAANNSGVTFSITAIGEIQYTSTNLAGASYVGEMAYSYQANGGAISGTSPNNISSDGLNYISTGNAESGTTGWTTYADAAASRPVDGTGGVANVTFTESSVAPLRGLKSFIFTKDAVNRQGQGADFDFIIDDASKAKVLTIDFDYLVNSGTFVAGTNTTDSDVIVYIYDVTNAILIEPSSIKLLGNSSTVANKFLATFQTSSNSNSYRLIFHVASVSALAYSLKIDNISVSPSKYVYGTPITDFQSTPLSGSWTTNTTYSNGLLARSGPNLIVKGKVSLAGVPNATPLSINIPSGLSIDTAKLTGTNGLQQVGVVTFLDAGIAIYKGVVMYSTTTSVGISNLRVQGSKIDQEGVTTTSPFTWGSGDSLEFEFIVPILGWSSSVQLSDSADTRVCAAIITGLSTPYTANNNIVLTTINKDSHGAYSTSTGLYTVPVSGFYKVTGWLNTNVGTSSTITAFVNGVSQYIIGTSPANGFIPFSGLVYADAGQQISLRCNGSWTAVSGGSNLSFERVTGPSAIAASELVAARYDLTSGQTISNGGGDVVINFNNRQFDTHGAYTSPNFTAPIAGKYDVFAYLEFSTTAGGGTIRTNIQKNGVAYSTKWSATQGGAAPWSSDISDMVELKAGETIRITTNWNGTNLAALSSNSRFAIKRVGN